MNFVPVTVFVADAEISAVARCTRGAIQLVSALSHYEMFYAPVGKLRVYVFASYRIMSLTSDSVSVVLHTQFYDNLAAFLFCANVRPPIFVCSVAGQRAELRATQSQLVLRSGLGEVYFEHGKYRFYRENAILTIDNIDLIMESYEYAADAFSLLFYFKIVFYERESDYNALFIYTATNVTATSKSLRLSAPGDHGVDACILKQKIQSLVASGHNAVKIRTDNQNVLDTLLVRSQHTESRIPYNAPRVGLCVADKLVRSVVSQYDAIFATRQVSLEVQSSDEEFGDLAPNEHEAAVTSYLKQGMHQQYTANKDETSKAPTLPTEVLYDIRETMTASSNEQTVELQPNPAKCATDDLSEMQPVETSAINLDYENYKTPECVDVVEEYFEEDEDNAREAFDYAVEHLQYGLSCLSKKKKPTHLAFRVTKYIILQQKVFCGNQVVVGIVGMTVLEQKQDRQRFRLLSKNNDELEFYATPEYVRECNHNVRAVLAGLARGFDAM